MRCLRSIPSATPCQRCEEATRSIPCSSILLPTVVVTICFTSDFLAHLAMPKMSLYDHHLSLSSLLLVSVSVDSSPINFSRWLLMIQ